MTTFVQREIKEEDMGLGEVEKFDTLDYPYGPDRYYAMSAVGRTPEEMIHNAIIEEVEMDSGKVYTDHFLRSLAPGCFIHKRAVEMVLDAFREKSA